MGESERQYAYVEFSVPDGSALDRLRSVAAELKRQKEGDAIRDEAHWLPYFNEDDRAEFWWPTEAESERWNSFWFSTPLPQRHNPEMPTPPWDFGSMIDAILDGEYELIGVARFGSGQARFDIDPHAYPYGGMGAVRALVRSFGHIITSFDDGTGVVAGDPRGPRWNGDVVPTATARRGFWDIFRSR
jgi:hypothetical protein